MKRPEPRLKLRVPGRRVVAGSVLGAALLLGGCAAPPAASVAPAPRAVAADPRLDAAARAHPVAFLDRIGWGADAAQLRQLQRLGATGLLDAQLRPDPRPELPEPLARQLAALPVNAPLEQFMPQLVAARRAVRMDQRAGGSGEADAAAMQLKALQQRDNALTRQAMAQQVLLAVYAPNQLQQRLTWFWMNHFNVFRNQAIGPMMADYGQRVIAPHALGHFRALLEATVFSPQMLLYLNNAQNAAGHINENYAREVMELHTLGVGSGYTQADVTSLAHVLSGLGVELTGPPPRERAGVWRRGLVVFRPARHDPRPEVVRGHVLQGGGIAEIEQVITLLADDPATARHVCLQLARYFVADEPDPAMVDAMVRAWGRSDGDIAAVLRAMYASPQFADSLARPQFKDPMRYVLSAARASLEGRTISNPQPLLDMLAVLAEPLYGRTTPDGYPMGGAAWNSPGQLTTRFQVAQQFAAGAPGMFGPAPPYLQPGAPPDAAAQRPRPAPPELARGAVFIAAAPDLRAATRQALAQAEGPVRWNALWLASPEFMNQ